MSGMTEEELFDGIDGLFAGDTGCADSGIRDERLRERVKAELRADLGAHELAGGRLTRFARRLLDPPYDLEDMARFIRWLDEKMDLTL